MVEVPISTIEALENSLGRRRRFGKYFGLTVASTSIVGAAFWGITWNGCSGPGVGVCLGTTRTGLTLAGFVAGAIMGLPLATIIGASVREEWWSPLALPAPAESGLTIRPVIGSGVGFAASIRFGGL